jgi:hypothetical protein
MTTPTSLLRKPEPDPEYLTALAREYLTSALRYCEEAEGDERLYRYHELADTITQLAAEAGIELTKVPKGQPRPVIEPANDQDNGDDGDGDGEG